jgi:hypothetical protein
VPPKKRLGKELPVGGSSLATGDQGLETITQPHTSVEPRPATTEIRRHEEPPEQPATQAEAPVLNTSASNTQQPAQHKETEAQEDQQQDSDEEMEAIIKDELACLCKENERLWFM